MLEVWSFTMWSEVYEGEGSRLSICQFSKLLRYAKVGYAKVSYRAVPAGNNVLDQNCEAALRDDGPRGEIPKLDGEDVVTASRYWSERCHWMLLECSAHGSYGVYLQGLKFARAFVILHSALLVCY